MWKNLAPNLLRQRLIIEGTTKEIVGIEQIKAYLLELAKISEIFLVSVNFISKLQSSNNSRRTD